MGIEGLIDGSAFAQQPEEQKVETEQPEKETEVTQDSPVTENKQPETPPSLEINDEMVFKYASEKLQRQITSFDDFQKETTIEKEVEKVVNPYENLMDDYDKKYFDFKKETGLGRKEFDFVQQDFSTKSDLDLAIERVRRDYDKNVSKEAAKSFLEKKLGIDLSTEEIEDNDKLELKGYAKPLLNDLTSQQEKYKATVAPKKESTNVEMVELENGQKLPKQQYEQLVKQREEYITHLTEGVSGATSFEVESSYDDNGEKRALKFAYDYSDDDRHSMLSDASNVDAFIASKFRTEKGFDYKGLAEFIDKAKNFEKYLGLAMQQARAEALEEKIAQDNNEQFTKVPQSKQQKNNGAKTILDLIPGN